MVSELGGGDKPGRIVLIDPVANERRVLAETTPIITEVETFPRCGIPPANLRPRGFHLSADREGILHLLVVAGSRVERYRADVSTIDVLLTWEGCVEVPTTSPRFPTAGLLSATCSTHHGTFYSTSSSCWA
jgi:hypothetical protein